MNNNENSGTESPHHITKLPSHDEITYEQVEKVVLEFLPGYQTGLKLVLAVAISSQFENPNMLWLLLVGAPASGKTDLVRLIKDSNISYYLDNLTQNAFISGERATKSHKVYDLLPELKNKCLIIKDWTAIFSLDEKMTRKILGDLVGIYDNEFAKFSSRRGNITYNSSFSQLGAITPSTLNKHSKYMNTVGPRFLSYSMPEVTENDKNNSYEIIFSGKSRSALETNARKHVSAYLFKLSKQKIIKKLLDDRTKNFFKIAADLVAKCRGIVLLRVSSVRNQNGAMQNYYELDEIQIEAPWRAVQQLISLSEYLAFVADKKEVGPDELEIIQEVVLSSMPANRAQALKLLKEHGGEITAQELANLSDRSTKTSRRLLDELCALQVLEESEGSGRNSSRYSISKEFADFVLLSPTDFLSSSNGTSNPHRLFENINKKYDN